VKLFVSVIGALTLGVAVPAIAGADWQTIERAREAKQATQMAHHGDPYEAAGPTAAGTRCPTDVLALPLDHGPRAQTTPQQNRLRMARHEAQLKACQQAAK